VAQYRGGKKQSELQRLTGQKNVIALRLIEARLAQRPPWSQERLCTELQSRGRLTIDQATIAKIETQSRGVYDYEIVAFALTLNVSTDWLLGLGSSDGSRAG
jgi:hypothetical protein